MFETMLRRLIFLLFGLPYLSTLQAQTVPCATVTDSAQLAALRVFQRNLDQNPDLLKKPVMRYVPLKVHIIGTDQGIGYFPISRLLNALCELNVRFEPTGFHFYLVEDVNYIDNSLLYAADQDEIYNESWTYKKEGAVNVFFHGPSQQWCGVYFGGLDVVFVQNGCQDPGETTLTHELGHFFSLPHTFYGWEGGNTPFDPEKIDGTNCRSAGDGFCDTRADYLSYRWGCPWPGQLKDPNGVWFHPDSSIYMSYSMDACQSRFSSEQMAAMRSNLDSRNIASNTADLQLLPAPQKYAPLQGDTTVKQQAATFVWGKVANAFAYHLQVARSGWWEFSDVDRLVFDTSATFALPYTLGYAWRVRAITAANTCSEFGVADSFIPKSLPIGLQQLSILPEAPWFANPMPVNSLVALPEFNHAEVHCSDISGRDCNAFITTRDGKQFFEPSKTGFYLLSIKMADRLKVYKLLVTPGE